MNNKGVTLVELLIVVVVISIIAAFSTTAIDSIVQNTKRTGFVTSSLNIIAGAKIAHTGNDDIWEDDTVTLRELIDSGYIKPLGKDPWGGEYDLDATYVTTSDIVTYDNNSDDTLVFLSANYVGNAVLYTPTTFRGKIVTSYAIIGFDGPLETFSKADIYFVGDPPETLVEKVVDIFNDSLSEQIVKDDSHDVIEVADSVTKDAHIVTNGGDDEVIVGEDVTNNSIIDTGDGNDTVSIGNHLKKKAEVLTGNGDDTVNIDYNMQGESYLDTGPGNDTVNLEGELNSKASMNTGAGDDTIVIKDDIQQDTKVETGPGNDNVTVGDRVSGNGILDTGTGDDVVSINKANGGVTTTGAGNDDLYITNLNNNAVVNTNEDNDEVHITNVSSSFVGTIDLGSGDDELTILDNSSSRYLYNTTGTFNGGAGYDTLKLPYVTKDKWDSGVSSLFSGFEEVILKDETLNP